MSTTITPITSADLSFVAKCVDPEAAKRDGSVPFITRDDIVATYEQWRTINYLSATLRARAVTALGCADESSWRVLFVRDAGRPGKYGLSFDNLGTYEIDSAGRVETVES